MSTSPRWKQRPPGSNWGDFGPNDQCGRMNLLTPAKVMQGMQEVRTGQTLTHWLMAWWPLSRHSGVELWILSLAFKYV